ncbi:hypothetical protein GWR56_02640 [Mucilaginibacter sp. 14171R-50]|uniref:hypothetical protein n=1 Tax=Mucilaginibacter sp. 14171R-50 TaxID=2703789 RepID=UPI00138DBB4A|nr:hypothetical protein [Mucilaginibacter sp. 14171R-50]QHS54493.1 hypothetical protein GWR56_02640 [Mucilaginibacter sp. 14171R-50]
MKKRYPKSNSAYLKFSFIALIALCGIIYGCRKEITNSKESTLNTDPAVADAKSWYESTFPVTGGSNQTVHTNSTGTGFDLSQWVKPDWQHTATYARLGKDVIEMPVDPDSKFNSILKRKINNRAYSKSYTRSSYLLLKDGKGYKAYIMTIVGDSSYIKGNPGKLANNTYRQHDADFSGLVLYFTPKGKYVNGYAYKNGQLVTPASQTQATGKTRVQLAEICTDWYDEILINDVIVSSTYLYTTCEGGYEEPNNPGTSGSPAPPPPPDPCAPPPPPVTPPPSVPDPPTGPPIPMAIPGHITVNNVPGGGGGFPPPVEDDEGDPCTDENEQDIIDKIDPKYPCAKQLLAMLPNLNSDISKFILKAFGSNNANSITFYDGSNTDFPSGSLEDGHTVGYDIYLNPAVLSNSSNEYRLVTMYHEALHAFLALEHSKLGSTAFAAKYPEIKVVKRQVINSNANKDPYNYYIDEGSYYTQVLGDPEHRTMAEYFTNELRDAILAYNPNFPIDRATALARYGIFLDPSIDGFNKNERDVTKGKSVGTKCTP